MKVREREKSFETIEKLKNYNRAGERKKRNGQNRRQRIGKEPKNTTKLSKFLLQSEKKRERERERERERDKKQNPNLKFDFKRT